MNKKLQKLSVHLIGVGGAGMSSLCKYLLSKNFTVSGSDKNSSEKITELTNEGLTFYEGHNGKNVERADVVVYSSAISSDNEELLTARSLNKAIYKRSELLNMILSVHKRSVGVCGSHGKTTATTMLSLILDYAKIKTSRFIGGNYPFNEVSFGAKVSVAEICEYAKNINDIKVDYAVCLNIDNDHLDTYKTIENLKNAFFSFLNKAKLKFINGDDKILKEFPRKKSVTFGLYGEYDFTAVNLKNESGYYSFDVKENGKLVSNITLKAVGKHNVYNSLSAIAVARKVFKVDYDKIREALSDFSGVERRFEHLGKIFNKNIICDYAHHPTELESVITTLKDTVKDYLIVFQPHTYSRTKILFDDFKRVLKGENAVLYKEFPSREKYDYEGSSERLAVKLGREYYDDFDKLLEKIKRIRRKTVVVLGAGDLYDKFKEKIKNA